MAPASSAADDSAAAEPAPRRMPPPLWNEPSPVTTAPSSPWTNALATRVERALGMPDGVHCPRCRVEYDVSPGTPLDVTRCGVCDGRGLVGDAGVALVSGSERRVRCPSCSAPFRTRAGFTHARCPACAVAVAPLPLDD